MEPEATGSSFLTGGKLNVETIRGQRDPLFGGVNPEPIDRNLAALKQRVIEKPGPGRTRDRRRC